MDERLHGWLVMGVSAVFFLLDGSIMLGMSTTRFSVFWVNSLSIVAVIVGLHFLWRTSILQRSPLSRFFSLAFGLLILGQLMKVMHWPYAVPCMLLAFLVNLVVYIVHFSLKRRWALRDILRLVVMVVVCTLFPTTILHWVPAVQVYWAIIGIISLASLEQLLNAKPNPKAAPQTHQTAARADQAPSNAELQSQFPELFDDER